MGKFVGKLIQCALAIAFLVVPGVAGAQNLILNPSFETLGQASWLSVINGPAAWSDSGAAPPTTSGVNGLTSNQGGPSSQILYQDIVLPATGNYTFSGAIGCDPQGGANTDFCRVDITNTNAATLTPPTPLTSTLATTNGNVIATLYTRDGTAGSGAQGPQAVTFAGTAGQTVRIRIMVQASNFFAFVFADALSLAAAQQIPTLSEWGLILLCLLLVAVAGFTLRRESRTIAG